MKLALLLDLLDSFQWDLNIIKAEKYSSFRLHMLHNVDDLRGRSDDGCAILSSHSSHLNRLNILPDVWVD